MRRMARNAKRKEPTPPQDDAGGDELAHWDPKNPRDMGAIRRMHARYPNAFRDMDAEKQAKLVRIVDKAADVAETMLDKDDALSKIQGAALADSVVRTGAMLATIRLRDEHHAADHNQRERHHADDVARGAGEGSKNLTIVLAGADGSRLLKPPPEAAT